MDETSSGNQDLKRAAPAESCLKLLMNNVSRINLKAKVFSYLKLWGIATNNSDLPLVLPLDLPKSAAGLDASISPVKSGE